MLNNNMYYFELHHDIQCDRILLFTIRSLQSEIVLLQDSRESLNEQNFRTTRQGKFPEMELYIYISRKLSTDKIDDGMLVLFPIFDGRSLEKIQCEGVKE